MGHVPHVYLPPPWGDGDLPLPEAARHHLLRVLRSQDGAPVDYTDGAGAVGRGALAGHGVRRGTERRIERPLPAVTVAAAPPKSADRARLVVEKLAELGVDRLLWLTTRFGEGRAPRPEKAEAWAVAALQQSRGAHRMAIGGPVGWRELPAPVLVATPGGGPMPTVADSVTVAVGPEAGWAPGEIPAAAAALGLGERILRVETAAIVAATVVLGATGRLGV